MIAKIKSSDKVEVQNIPTGNKFYSHGTEYMVINLNSEGSGIPCVDLSTGVVCFYAPRVEVRLEYQVPVSFAVVKVGEMFQYNSSIYVKVDVVYRDNVSHRHDGEKTRFPSNGEPLRKTNVVRLTLNNGESAGRLGCFDNDTLVTPVSSVEFSI